MAVKSQSTTSYFTVPSHMNSGSHLITFIISPSHHQEEEYIITVSGKKIEIVKHHLYSFKLNYYICIMSGLYDGLFKRHPTTTISFIHIHGSQEFSHVISICMIPHPGPSHHT